MPGTRCAVSTCNNSLVKTKQKNLDISYHTFPKNELSRKAWMAACNRTTDLNPDTSVVCSIHFTDQDFETDLRSRLLNLKIKRRLKSTAVPSLFLLRDESKNTCPEAEEPPLYQNGFNAVIVNRQPNNLSISDCSEPLKPECIYLVESFTESYESELPNVLSTKKELQDPNTSELAKLNFKVKYKILLVENHSLEMKYKKLRDSCKEQKRKLGQLGRELSQTTKKFKTECIKKRKMQVALNSIFSKTQQDIVIHNKKKVVWRNGDLLKAFTLWCLSKRGYIYIRNTLKYPLPRSDTLVRWARKQMGWKAETQGTHSSRRF